MIVYDGNILDFNNGDLSGDGSPGSTPYVISFNTRKGAVTLTAQDVINALGYIPGSGTGGGDIEIEDVEGLEDALDGKQPVGDYADAVHTHVIADVTGLQTALNSKAGVSHTHVIGDVTGLQASLDSKQPAGSYATGGGTATGTNTGDQTSIVGITGTLAQFNTALTGADFATGGGTATGTNTGDQTTITGNAGTATTLQNPRTIAISGKATGTATSFNGSANITIPITAVTLAAADIPTIAQSQVTNLTTDLAGKQPLDAQLTDFAALTYAGNAGKVLSVNAGATGLVFSTPAAGSSIPTGTGFTHITAGAQDVAAKLVDLVDMANVGTGTVFYRKTAGTGVPEVQTLATLKTDLNVTKADVGLGNVDNTSDANKPVSTAQATAIGLKQDADGDLSAIAALAGTSGLLKKTAANTWTLDTTTYQVAGSYQPLDTQLTDLAGLVYTANGSKVVRVNSGATAFELATLTKSDVGLSNVDNTSDANKPVSTAQATAIGLKENTITATTTADYYRGDKTFVPLNKAAVGLSNVDNTSDANKPVSTAQQTALNLKANLAGGNSFTGTQQVEDITASGMAQFNGDGGGGSLNHRVVGTGVISGSQIRGPSGQIELRQNGIYSYILGLALDGVTRQDLYFRGATVNIGDSTNRFVVSPTGAHTIGTLTATGNVSGANLSGTNTGDQTTITGNAGSATILQTGRTISTTGDVTYTSGSFNGSANVTGTATIAAGAVTFSKMANLAANSFIANNTGVAAVPAAISIADAKTMLGLAGTNSGDQFTNMTSSRILGRSTAGFGAAEELTSAQVKALLAYVAADIAYTALETGGTSRTLQEKFGDFIYPKDFGCVCDGTTDDVVNFRKAVTAAATSRKILYMPKTIKLGGVVNVPSGTNIMGPASQCIIESTAATYNGFFIQGSDVSISNLMFYDNNKTGGWDFVYDCSAVNIERTRLHNINAFNSWGGISDTGTTGLVITARITDCQWRGHRGHGIRWTRSFAFTFHNEVAIDYVGVVGTSANFTGFYYNGAGMGAGAGGVFWRDCDVLGTATAQGTTAPGMAAIANQNGWQIFNTAAVGIFHCRADGLGGVGYDLNSINTLSFVNPTAAHCNNHHYQFTAVTQSTAVNLVAFGRVGAAEPTTDGVTFVGTANGGCQFTGGYIRDFKGAAINKPLTQGGGFIQFSNFYLAGNGYGVFAAGTSGFVVSNCTFLGNTNDYLLGPGYNFIVSCLVGVDIVNANPNGTTSIFVNGNNIVPKNVNVENNRSQAWNTTTPGLNTGGVHFDVGTADNHGNAVTWGTYGSATNAGAGIYATGVAATGSKMLLGTTDNFGTGVKTAIEINHLGWTSIRRGALNLNPITAPASPANGDIWYDSGASKFKKREAGVTSDLVPAAGTGTVTQVSVASVNGVNGTVATDTTTPVITINLDDIKPDNINVSNNRSQNWNQTTPGSAQGSIHVDALAATNGGPGITFSAYTAGALASGGIYMVGDAALGSTMLFGTTDSFATGSKTAISINHLGYTSIRRGALNLNPIATPAALADGDIWYETGVGFKKRQAGATTFLHEPTAATHYMTVLDSSGSHVAARVAGTYGMGQGDPIAISGTGTLYPLNIMYIDPADYPAIGSKTAKMRIRCTLAVNDVAPTGNFTIALHPVTRPATSGGAALNTYTIGAAVASSGVTSTAPAADSINNLVGSDFAVPTAGFYVIGVVTTATVAASSHVHLSAALQMRHS